MILRDWQPLLSGPLASAAAAAVEAIAADLGALASLIRPFGADPAFSLAGGTAGSALFLAYLAEQAPGRGYGDRAMDLLEQAIGSVATRRVAPGLYDGFAGVAWTLEHLRGRTFDDGDGEDSGAGSAAFLLDLLGQTPWRRPCDLISGLVGFGIYALERLARPGGGEILEQVLARLAETAEECPEGTAWRTPSPEGRFDAGVAHGVPGVIGLLAAAARDGAEVRPLLDGAVRWLLAQRPFPSRLAWCHGDLGIAAALLGAARVLGEAAWEGEALALARCAAGRACESSGVEDAGLCHGAAGNGHLFNRLAQATGEEVFAAAARRWFGRLLAMRRPHQGIGGFQALVADGRGGKVWADDPGFLTGSSGIGLALLAAVSPVEPAWDRLLLASLPGSSWNLSPDAGALLRRLPAR